MSDRRSLLSVASGIYEEIPDLPEGTNTNALCTITCDVPDGVFKVNIDESLVSTVLVTIYQLYCTLS